MARRACDRMIRNIVTIEDRRMSTVCNCIHVVQQPPKKDGKVKSQ
jgi:hypothetical protein